MVAFNYWFTLAALFAAAVCSAGAFSGYLISRRRSFIIAYALFAVYFIDIASVFFDFFSGGFLIAQDGSPYAIGHPVSLTLTGALTSGGIWLIFCEKLNSPTLKKKSVMIAPIAVYVIASLLAYWLVPGEQLKCFVFFDVRQLFNLFTFAVYLFFYGRADIRERVQTRPKLPEVLLLIALSLGVILENVVTMFWVIPYFEGMGIAFSASRNYFENLLFITLGALIVRDAWQTISVHAKIAPDAQEDKGAAHLEQILPRYAQLYDLSQREQDVLRFILKGLDNQNIATELTLSPGTVKVHTHNILKKTGCANRQELIQDFWKRH